MEPIMYWIGKLAALASLLYSYHWSVAQTAETLQPLMTKLPLLPVAYKGLIIQITNHWQALIITV